MNEKGHLQGDIIALLGFTAAAAGCYVLWFATGYRDWICYSIAVIAVAALGWWLRWLWPRLALWLTKFFCVAALFDLLMEGFIHPFHPETLLAKLACQLTLFLVYAFYLIVLRPIDVRLINRAPMARG
jgi:hypothetical protein